MGQWHEEGREMPRKLSVATTQDAVFQRLRTKDQMSRGMPPLFLFGDFDCVSNLVARCLPPLRLLSKVFFGLGMRGVLRYICSSL